MHAQYALGTHHLPLDGGGVSVRTHADGGGARAIAKSAASRGAIGNAGGLHPLSHASHDSSPIEGEQEARTWR
jgi:hypothetical protein